MKKFLIRNLTFIVFLLSMSAHAEPIIPLGMCPEEGQLSVLISELMESESPSTAGFAHALLPQDVNGDGYACAVFRCSPCPPNAKVCNEVCNWTGPLSDNDVPF